VISGDVLTDIDPTELVKAHRCRRRGVDPSSTRENPVSRDRHHPADGTIERFSRSPVGEVFSDTINTGIYVMSLGVRPYRRSAVVDFVRCLPPPEDGATLHGHVAEGYWEDVGTEAYISPTDVLDGRWRSTRGVPPR
jgi:mannose-1-phosphate guanylyltransferase/phosphomannomutase